MVVFGGAGGFSLRFSLSGRESRACWQTGHDVGRSYGAPAKSVMRRSQSWQMATSEAGEGIGRLGWSWAFGWAVESAWLFVGSSGWF